MSVWGWVSSGEWFRKEFSQTKREAQTIEKLKKKKKRVTGTNSERRDILLTWFGRGCPVSGNGPCKKLLMSDLFYPMVKDFCKGGSGIFLHDNSFAHEGIMGQSLMAQSH